MEQILLDTQLRNVTGKAVRHLRREGYIPAVVYGHRTEPVSLQVSERALSQALRVAGTNRLISLTVPGQESPKQVLVRELQRDALSHAMLHVDFYEVVMTEKITAEVPVVLIGESKLVKGGGGLLFQGLDAIEVECLPGDLPQQVEIDLSGLLEIDQTIVVRDLKLGDGVQVLTDLNEVVVKILPPEEEEVEEAPAPVEAAEVEVVGKKVKAEEEILEQEEQLEGKEKQQPAAKEKSAPAAKEK